MAGFAMGDGTSGCSASAGIDREVIFAFVNPNVGVLAPSSMADRAGTRD